MGIAAPVLFLVIFIILLGVYMMLGAGHKSRHGLIMFMVLSAIACAVSFIMATVVSIPAGHYGVATLFGKVVSEPYAEGLHYSNPLYKWGYYDCRQKTYKDKALVPSQDQLMTTFDVSVQYSLDGAKTPQILKETGTINDMLEVQLRPKLRSVLREQGKSVVHAEDFYKEDVQKRLQNALLTSMQEYLAPKGMNVSAVLLRDIQLPETVRQGVEAKKRREQEAERQKAELRRFETEQQQKVAQAKAEREAAEQEALKKKVLADAQAYEIEKINKAIASNPAYIKLEALKALQQISKDPAAKIYFLNGQGKDPLPLLHIGDDAGANIGGKITK